MKRPWHATRVGAGSAWFVERAGPGCRAAEWAGRGERRMGCGAGICIEGAFQTGKQAETAIWRAEKFQESATFRQFPPLLEE